MISDVFILVLICSDVYLELAGLKACIIKSLHGTVDRSLVLLQQKKQEFDILEKYIQLSKAVQARHNHNLISCLANNRVSIITEFSAQLNLFVLRVQIRKMMFY